MRSTHHLASPLRLPRACFSVTFVVLSHRQFCEHSFSYFSHRAVCPFIAPRPNPSVPTSTHSSPCRYPTDRPPIIRPAFLPCDAHAARRPRCSQTAHTSAFSPLNQSPPRTPSPASGSNPCPTLLASRTRCSWQLRARSQVRYNRLTILHRRHRSLTATFRTVKYTRPASSPVHAVRQESQRFRLDGVNSINPAT